MKNILGLITAAALISATFLPYAASAEARPIQKSGKFTCKMQTKAQLDAEDKVASAKAFTEAARVNFERHRNACELSEALAAQADINYYVAALELKIAKEQHKETAKLKQRVADLKKHFETISKNLPKLEKNEGKALLRYEAAQEELDKAQAALARLSTCSTQVITPKQPPIPFPIPKAVVAKAALDKAQAAYDQASEALRKEELRFNEVKYERAVADVEYMLAEAKLNTRKDLANKAAMNAMESFAKAIMAGMIFESERLNNQYVHEHCKKQSQIQASDAGLKLAQAIVEQCAEQLEKAERLANRARTDLNAATAAFASARNNFANAQLRMEVSGDQFSFTQAQKVHSESELAKAKSAFDAASQEEAK
jgi:hypothetical protein